MLSNQQPVSFREAFLRQPVEDLNQADARHSILGPAGQKAGNGLGHERSQTASRRPGPRPQLLDQVPREANRDRLLDLHFRQRGLQGARRSHIPACLGRGQGIALGQQLNRLRGAMVAPKLVGGIGPFGAFLQRGASHGSHNNACI